MKLKEIKHKWDILKIKWMLFRWEKYHFKCRKKYCNKGFHKLVSHKTGLKEPKKRWKYVEFLKCRHCNYMFFTTLKQKQKYLRIHGKDKDSFSAFLKTLSSAKTEQSNSKGRVTGEGVSSSCHKKRRDGCK